MPQRGPQPKDPRRRQRRADPKSTSIEPHAHKWVTTPDGRRDWLKVTRQEWDMLWAEPLHGAFDLTDVPELYRLYDMRDERVRKLRQIRRGITIEGPDGQPVRVAADLVPGSTTNLVLNPLFKRVEFLDGQITAQSDRFALNLKARLAMNVDTAKIAKALEELNAPVDDDDDDGPDPRDSLSVVQLPTRDEGRAATS